MLILNRDLATVDIRKLRDYCLNLEHDDVKHKARRFSSILGMKSENAEKLREILLAVVKTHEAKLGRQDEYGQRYTTDFEIQLIDRLIAHCRFPFLFHPSCYLFWAVVLF